MTNGAWAASPVWPAHARPWKIAPCCRQTDHPAQQAYELLVAACGGLHGQGGRRLTGAGARRQAAHRKGSRHSPALSNAAAQAMDSQLCLSHKAQSPAMHISVDERGTHPTGRDEAGRRGEKNNIQSSIQQMAAQEKKQRQQGGISRGQVQARGSH